MGPKSRGSRSIRIYIIHQSTISKLFILVYPFILTCFLFPMPHYYFSFILLVIGEDPFLTGQYSKAFVQALQGTSFRDDEGESREVFP